MNVVLDAISNSDGALYKDGNLIQLYEGFDPDSIAPLTLLREVFRRLHLNEAYLSSPTNSYTWLRRTPGGAIKVVGIHCDKAFRRKYESELCGQDGLKLLNEIVNNPTKYGCQLVTLNFPNKSVDVPSSSDWNKVANANIAATRYLQTEGQASRAEYIDKHLDLLSGKYYIESTDNIGIPSDCITLDDSLISEFDDTFIKLDDLIIPFELIQRSSFKLAVDTGRGITIFKRYTKVQLEVTDSDLGRVEGKYYLEGTDLRLGIPASQLIEDYYLINTLDIKSIREHNDNPQVPTAWTGITLIDITEDFKKNAMFKIAQSTSIKIPGATCDGVTVLKKYKSKHVNPLQQYDLLCMSDDPGKLIHRTYKSIRQLSNSIDLSELSHSITIGSDTVQLNPLSPGNGISVLLLITLDTGKFLNIIPTNNTLYDEGNFRIEDGVLISSILIRSITAYYEIAY